MYRIVTSLAIVGALTFTPALASAATDHAPTDRQPAATDVRPQDGRPGDARFACALHRSDRGPVVGCSWTAVGEDRAAGYRLWRTVDDGPRQVVFETRENRRHAHRDLVRPGHRYRYAVQYVAEDGAVLHTSAVVHIAVPPQRRA